jgi:serine/threonine protein kinase
MSYDSPGFMEVPGDQTIGRYRRLAELGRGGMATVYLAAARGPQGFTKLVVLKELRPDLAQDAEFRTMFLDEARLAARLNHPNVVQTYEVGEDGQRQVIVMEYLEGQPLSRARKVLPSPLVYFALSNVLTGLEHAHDLLDFQGRPLKVVHRDVSPHNIFVTYSGEVKLCDFGIAKAADSSAVTATGDMKGKLSYMAPEQARGEVVDARADLFGVGVVLWETATGRRLWHNLHDVQILAQLMAGSIPTPRSVDPTVPERLERICMKALAFDPAERYSTAAELQAELDAYIASLGLTPTRRALGEAVAQAFADDRARLKQVIEEQLRNASVLTTGESPAVMYAPASIRSSPSGLSANAPSAPSRVSPATRSSFPPSDASIRGMPTLVEEQGGGSSGGRTGAGAVRSIAPAPTSAARGRAWFLGVVVSALAVLTVAGLVVKAQLAGARALSGSATSSATPSEASASSASIAVGSTSTLATPRTARMTLRGVPAGAAVSLDGVPAALATDGTIERPAGETHRLKVEAPGFVTDERSITFDADRAIEVRMARARAGSGPTTRPTTSARAGTPKPTDPSDVLGY